MNLPPPFNKAKGVKANPDGSISLIDARGKALARIPMNTAFELSKRVAGGEKEYFSIASGGGTGIGGNGWREGDGCTAHTSQK